MIVSITKNWIEWLISLILLVIGMYMVPVGMTGFSLDYIPGDLGDSRFVNYIFEHGYLWLKGEVSSFWNAPFMYPQPHVVALSDNLLGTLPLYAIFREFGFDRETALQLWIITIFFLNFLFCFWAAFKLTGNKVLAASAAYLFAFSIYIFGQSNHIQMFPKFIIPLVFYWGYRYMSTLNIKYFSFIMLGTVYQIYCGVYLGFFTILCVASLTIAYMIAHQEFKILLQFKSVTVTFKHIAIVGISTLLLTPLLLPYLSEVEKSGYRDWDQVLNSLPDLRSYFFSTEASKTWSILSKHGETHYEHWWNQQIFPGLIPIIAFAAGLFTLRYNPRVNESFKKLKTFVLCTLIISLFTLNINGYSLYWLIYNLPGYGALRSLDRIINLNIFFLSIITVLLIKILIEHKKSFEFMIYLLPALIITDNLVNSEKIIRIDKDYSVERIAYVKDIIRSQAGSYLGPIAYFPTAIPGQYFEIHLDVMLACQDLGIPCVNGYSGSAPVGFTDFELKMNEPGLQIWLDKNKIPEQDIVKIFEWKIR